MRFERGAGLYLIFINLLLGGSFYFRSFVCFSLRFFSISSSSLIRLIEYIIPSCVNLRGILRLLSYFPQYTSPYFLVSPKLPEEELGNKRFGDWMQHYSLLFLKRKYWRKMETFVFSPPFPP